jgi:hypothetical protein
VAIVHRRVQLLVGHLDRSGLFGGGSTVAWGGSGDRFRLHLVACARTRSARDGRWPSLPWGWAGVSQGATGKAHRENASRESAAGQVGAGHTKQRRDLGGTDAGGAGSTVQSAGVTGKAAATARQGRAGGEGVHGARRTRLVGLPNDSGGGAEVRVRLGWRCTG